MNVRQNLEAMIDSPENIINRAIEEFKATKFVLLVSGGHDSVTAAHVSAAILKAKRFPFVIYHGDTTIGIPETQEYVKQICGIYGWDLNIRRPPNRDHWYDRLIEKYGFPGPTKTSHRIMYRLLKERALRKFITYEVKSVPRSRERIALLTGIRQDESRIRMGYSEAVTRMNSWVWVSPIFHWSDQDCKDYMKSNAIPKNPVKEKICISGECLCGCFARREEFVELKVEFPHVAMAIEDLHKKAIAAGFPWKWGQGPKAWREEESKKRQTDLFMCVGCEQKHTMLD